MSLCELNANKVARLSEQMQSDVGTSQKNRLKVSGERSPTAEDALRSSSSEKTSELPSNKEPSV
jgi:hypothetical protein